MFVFPPLRRLGSGSLSRTVVLPGPDDPSQSSLDIITGGYVVERGDPLLSVMVVLRERHPRRELFSVVAKSFESCSVAGLRC